MLHNVPTIIDPELLYILASMGHGDQIVIADDFYPARSKSESANVLYNKGVDATELIEAIIKLMPLDADFCEHPLLFMVADEEAERIHEVHEEVIAVISKNNYNRDVCGPVKRSDFYELASKAFATVSTGESRPYGCFILQKGVK